MIQHVPLIQVKNNAVSFTNGENVGEYSLTYPALPQVDIKGDNTIGLITINTGVNCSGSLIGVFNFTSPNLFSGDNIGVIITPANRAAVGLVCAAEAITAAGFEFNCSSVLDDLSVYQFYYQTFEMIP